MPYFYDAGPFYFFKNITAGCRVDASASHPLDSAFVVRCAVAIIVDFVAHHAFAIVVNAVVRCIVVVVVVAHWVIVIDVTCPAVAVVVDVIVHCTVAIIVDLNKPLAPPPLLVLQHLCAEIEIVFPLREKKVPTTVMLALRNAFTLVRIHNFSTRSAIQEKPPRSNLLNREKKVGIKALVLILVWQ